MGTRWKTIAAAACVVIGATATTGTASAGDVPAGNLQVRITVDGLAPATVLGDLTIEVWALASTDPDVYEQVTPVPCVDAAPDVTGLPWTVVGDFDCTFTPPVDTTQFAIGLDGIPELWRVSGGCSDGPAPTEMLDLGGNEQFAYFGFGSAECALNLDASILFVDKVVDGGDAVASDFTIEVLDSGAASVTSGSDVADTTCEADFDVTKCEALVVPAGTGFQIAEPSVTDYELTSVECDEFLDKTNPPAGAVEPIGDDGFRTDDGDTYCVVTNSFVPPATTTTTTTTTTTAPTTTTTTLPATTTTSIDAGVVTLPGTGASAATNTAIAAIAALFLLLGGAMLAVRRRET